MKKVIRIGVMSYESFQKRIIDIVAGRYKPKANEPRIWFASLKSMAEVLSDDNREMLGMIRREKPASLAELSQLTGRTVPDLSRTLMRMEPLGIVELQNGNHDVRPVVKAERFEIHVSA